MIRLLLIANRGEIALRILRTCRELGIEVVALHSSADSDSEVVRLADIAVNIEAPGTARRCYLNIPNIVERRPCRPGADAVHPRLRKVPLRGPGLRERSARRRDSCSSDLRPR
ncbi:biotin carboxylase N-terminal domain-containing protein [Rathayibacter oskolensis]|uniref:biotin carboxylase N-terminal domain-containing protein n=1 Tax=Rathayibacter oskolensis TaxID=1891671 RepID=UPI00265ED221|nr:biotin carboxylase N-terminal domain-containing protein [Rathayibacter oskolensis]WKK71305.1 biotin carboxylase N-terminal domain-containing protein [Rathayibacter oskolensis]